jgi:hypothetical protein
MRHSLSWALGATLAVAMCAPAGGAAQEPVSVTEGETRPIQLSVFNPVQIQPDWTSIAGLRLSLFHSVNQDMIGFDWVLAGVNVTRGHFAGLAWSWIGLNWVAGEAIGWQGALGNVALGGLRGLQTGALNLTGDEAKGVQFGAVNVADRMTGLQLAVVNIADDFRGLQLGVVNVTRAMHGVQLGLVNIITEGPLPFMVLANASF